MRSMARIASRISAQAADASERRFIDASLFNLFWIFVITSFIGLVGETPIAQFFNQWFGNDWMSSRFGALSMWTDLATGR